MKMGTNKYTALLTALYQLAVTLRKDGPQAVESHVEEPDKSKILKIYSSCPGATPEVLEIICDTLRVILSFDVDADQIEHLFQEDILRPNLSRQTEMQIVYSWSVMLISGAPPLLCIEASRRNMPASSRISYNEMKKII